MSNSFKTKVNGFGCNYSLVFNAPTLRVASGVLPVVSSSDALLI